MNILKRIFWIFSREFYEHFQKDFLNILKKILWTFSRGFFLIFSTGFYEHSQQDFLNIFKRILWAFSRGFFEHSQQDKSCIYPNQKYLMYHPNFFPITNILERILWTFSEEDKEKLKFIPRYYRLHDRGRTKGSLKNTTIGRIDKDVCLKNIGRMKAVFGKSSRILGRRCASWRSWWHNARAT